VWLPSPLDQVVTRTTNSNQKGHVEGLINESMIAGQNCPSSTCLQDAAYRWPLVPLGLPSWPPRLVPLWMTFWWKLRGRVQAFLHDKTPLTGSIHFAMLQCLTLKVPRPPISRTATCRVGLPKRIWKCRVLLQPRKLWKCRVFYGRMF
jgi:hypothetical protein